MTAPVPSLPLPASPNDVVDCPTHGCSLRAGICIWRWRRAEGLTTKKRRGRPPRRPAHNDCDGMGDDDTDDGGPVQDRKSVV